MEAILPASPLALALAALVTAVAALLQGTLGFGFAVLSVPILSLIDPVLAPVPQLLVAIPLTLTMAFRERHAMDLRGVGWVLLGRVPGALLGLLLLKAMSDRALDLVIAGMVLVAVLLVASGVHVRRTKGTEFGAGLASGLFGLVSSIGGPPLALLYRESGGPALRSSLAAIFSFGLLITLTTRAAGGEITASDAKVAVVLLPGLFLGLWASRGTAGRVDGPRLRAGILVVSALAALGLVVRVAV